MAELTALIDAHWADSQQLGQSSVAIPVAIDKHLANEMVEGDEYVMWPN